MKFPACLPLTESMFITELRLPNLTVDMPATSDIGLLLMYHLNSIGKSPDETMQDTLTVSPKLAGASPKLKGAIFGGTVEKDALRKEMK